MAFPNRDKTDAKFHHNKLGINVCVMVVWRIALNTLLLETINDMLKVRTLEASGGVRLFVIHVSAGAPTGRTRMWSVAESSQRVKPRIDV